MEAVKSENSMLSKERLMETEMEKCERKWDPRIFSPGETRCDCWCEPDISSRSALSCHSPVITITCLPRGHVTHTNTYTRIPTQTNTLTLWSRLIQHYLYDVKSKRANEEVQESSSLVFSYLGSYPSLFIGNLSSTIKCCKYVGTKVFTNSSSFCLTYT